MSVKSENLIRTALTTVTKREWQPNEVGHLVNDGVLDSLDSAVFLYELEKLADTKIPEEAVTAKDLYNVRNLIEFLDAH